jgi:hypothetical protein
MGLPDHPWLLCVKNTVDISSADKLIIDYRFELIEDKPAGNGRYRYSLRNW